MQNTCAVERSVKSSNRKMGISARWLKKDLQTTKQRPGMHGAMPRSSLFPSLLSPLSSAQSRLLTAGGSAFCVTGKHGFSCYVCHGLAIQEAAGKEGDCTKR